MSLPPEQVAAYTPIIDSILAASDLNLITAKRIRKGLQAAVHYDIEPQKEAITALIMERFDIFSPKAAAAAPPAHADLEKPLNGHHSETSVDYSHTTSHHSPSPVKRQSDSDALSDVIDDKPPKKKKKLDSVAEDDAKLAARLQAEEDSRARPTRGGNNRKKTTSRSTPKKKFKSATRIKGDRGSDSDSGTGEEKNVKRTGAFHKPQNLSPALSDLLGGETVLSRPQTVKKIWEYVHAHDLQDPDDKRQIRCDSAMRAVFKQDRVHMFTMNKILSTHLYPRDE